MSPRGRAGRAGPRVREDGVHVAGLGDLDTATLHDVLRLRVEVFVVEQECAYPEIDGRDSEPDTLHLWLPGADVPVAAYLRVLAEPGGVARIGRVVTAAPARGRGLAGRLLVAALDELDGPDGVAAGVVLDAQAHLAGFYAGFGFVVDGPEFVEDGIPHVPMRRDAATARTTRA